MFGSTDPNKVKACCITYVIDLFSQVFTQNHASHSHVVCAVCLCCTPVATLSTDTTRAFSFPEALLIFSVWSGAHNMGSWNDSRGSWWGRSSSWQDADSQPWQSGGSSRRSRPPKHIRHSKGTYCIYPNDREQLCLRERAREEPVIKPKVKVLGSLVS